MVYSDLNLGAGCVGRYICNDGYTLQTLRGEKEFACDEHGVWDGDVITAPVKCLCEFKLATVRTCESMMYIHR